MHGTNMKNMRNMKMSDYSFHKNELLLLTREGKVPVHTMKAYRDSGGIAPPFLNLGSRWRKVISFTSPPLYPQEKTSGTQ